MNSFFNLKIIKIVILTTFFEVLCCALIPELFYFFKHGHFSFQVIKYFLFFSLLKIIFMIYPVILFLILLLTEKLIVKYRSIKFAFINGLTYILVSLLFVVFIPDTKLFFDFNFQSEFSGFFYFALFGGIMGMIITAKLFPSLFAINKTVE